MERTSGTIKKRRRPDVWTLGTAGSYDAQIPHFIEVVNRLLEDALLVIEAQRQGDTYAGFPDGRTVQGHHCHVKQKPRQFYTSSRMTRIQGLRAKLHKDFRQSQ